MAILLALTCTRIAGNETRAAWTFASGVRLLRHSLTYDDDHRLRRFERGSNLWEDGVEQKVVAALSPGSIFVDGGAAFGYYSILAHRAGATVHAFNPHPRFAQDMVENLDLNGVTTGVCLHRSALGEAPGHARLEYGTGAGLGTRGAHVAVTTLDLLAGQPMVVKLDVEGYAGYVLRGATQLLAAHNTTWFIAVHGGQERRDVVRLLAGYTLTILTRTPNELVMAVPR
jgi:FkbM family methyltransferase